MLHTPPISTLFPYTTLFRSLDSLMSEGGEAPPPDNPPPQKDQDGPGLAMSRGRFVPPSLDIRQRGLTPAPHDIAESDLVDRKSTRLNSSHLGISYAVFCLKK